MTTSNGDTRFPPPNGHLPPEVVARIAEGFYGRDPELLQRYVPGTAAPNGNGASSVTKPPGEHRETVVRAAPATGDVTGPTGLLSPLKIVPPTLALVHQVPRPSSGLFPTPLLPPETITGGVAPPSPVPQGIRAYDSPAYYFLPESPPEQVAPPAEDLTARAGRGRPASLGDVAPPADAHTQGYDRGGLWSGAAPAAVADRVTAPALLTNGLPSLDTPAYYFVPEPPPETESRHPGDTAAAGARGDFPALDQEVNGRPLVWLDNAATTHKPKAVIDAVTRFYERDNSNVHRGAHALARRATDAYEEAREKTRAFIGATFADEIIWVRGTTEAINLVAQTYGRRFVGPGDEVIVSTLEHHSNIVPWQMLCQANDAVLRVIPISDEGELLLDEYAGLLSSRTRVVAITAVSNVIGTVTPLRQVVDMAHAAGAIVLVDGAQAVQHMPVHVTALDADFFAFSGHKLFGPTGIGALYGKRELLERMPPWQGGGSMIDQVSFENTTYAPAPAKFEAGTGHLAGAVGLGAAIDYVNALGLETIAAHEQRLMIRATEGLAQVPGLRHLAPGPGRVSALPFVIAGVAPERIGAFLDRQGIAVRAGHHCCQPLHRWLDIAASLRASFYVYNSADEVDALVDALNTARRMYRRKTA